MAPRTAGHAGYLNDPEATALALGADGWLRTGDICRADADGYFYVVDRLKELVKCGGAHVAPGQLEAILLAHPGVADAAVIGTPDDELGEVPKAFVVVKEPVQPAELISFVAHRVAPHKQIRQSLSWALGPRLPLVFELGSFGWVGTPRSRRPSATSGHLRMVKGL